VCVQGRGHAISVDIEMLECMLELTHVLQVFPACMCASRGRLLGAMHALVAVATAEISFASQPSSYFPYLVILTHTVI
jgi:hypothetical protein